MIKALIFDFDGLILETETPIFQSWQEIYQVYGCELMLEEWLANVGTAEEQFDPFTSLEQRSGQPIDRLQTLIRRQRRELELIEHQRVLPGVREYLESARRLGLRVGLASSSSCDWVVGHLERLGLIGYFDAIAASDDVALTKPDPALYRTAVEWLGVAPREAVAFEDSRNGLIAAKRAGLYCVVIPNTLTHRLDLDDADIRLGSLEEMPLAELLASLERVTGVTGNPL
jgi:HAD superfamily hydrolase (TIGR01509 family)